MFETDAPLTTFAPPIVNWPVVPVGENGSLVAVNVPPEFVGLVVPAMSFAFTQK
jgi:hypothetical protein